VIIAVIANEPERQKLIQVSGKANLLAPPSVHWEVGNAFSAMLRRGRTTIRSVQQALAFYAKVPIRFVPLDLEEALELAGALKLYAYDAYLLACARRYRAPLLTLDKGLQAQASAAGVEVLELD